MSSKLGKIVANFNSQLSTKLAVGGTTASINSNTDLDGVSIPDGRYFITLDLDNSKKEHFSCELAKTSTGANLTALKTLNRTTGAETSGALREHKIGSKVTITDFASILKIVQILGGTETLDGSSPLSYDTQPTLSSGVQLATVQYVLDNIAGGTVSFDTQTLTSQTSGEALTANDIVYFKESDQKWYKADADLTATFDQLQLGIAKTTVAINSGLSIGISGPMTGFTGLTAGSKYYLSNTAGAITTTAGTFSVFIGWALSTTSILFNPLNKTAPTQKEKDALGGSQGVPSSTNKYITQDNVYSDEFDQSQTTQNSSVSVGEANSTTLKNKIAQSFIPTRTKMRGVKLYKSANTGTFAGTVTVSLQADTAGSPSGSALATKTFTNASWLAFPTGEVEIIFSTEYLTLTAGNLYWVVIETSTSDTSNHPNLGTNTAGGYANGSVKYNNTTDSWVTIATIDLYFKTINSAVGQIAQGYYVQELFTSPGTFTWNKPTNAKKILVELWGGGGSGASAVAYAGGGAGGAYNQGTFLASDVSSTETIVVAAGGTAVTGAVGITGGNSSFGTKIYAYGGGGGSAGSGAAGSGGGGILSAGAVATPIGGSPRSANFTDASFGGGNGGVSASTQNVGYNSVYGGGGTSGYFSANGGLSGNSVYGGGAGENSDAGGGNTAGTSVFGGTGGARGSSANGTAGGVRGGGGGGCQNASFTSGAGGRGEVRITTYF